MDSKYWNKFYLSNDKNMAPSAFGSFIVGKYSNTKHGGVIDLGCGNGRDTFYLSQNNISVVGIDQCVSIININKVKKEALGSSATFVQADFCSIDYDKLIEGSYSIYSRFTLHAINYEEEDRLIKNLVTRQNLKYLFIEVRSINDDLYGQGQEVGLHEFTTTHYRRFTDPETLRTKLEKYFEIEFMEESRGLSKTKEEDPCLIRVIARKL